MVNLLRWIDGGGMWSWSHGAITLLSLHHARYSTLHWWTKGTEPWVMLGGNTWVELLNIHLDCHPHLKESDVFN